MVSKKKEVLRKLSYYLVLEVIIVILAEIQFFLGSNFLEVIIVILAEIQFFLGSNFLGSNMYYVVMCIQFFLGSNFLGSNMYYVVMCARVRKLLGF